MAGERSQVSWRAHRALDAVNFFLADIRDGLGPYLAVYLLTAQKWDEASIGVVMAQGIGAALSTTLAGLVVVQAAYSVALLTLAAVAAVGCVVFITGMPETRTQQPAQLDGAATASPRRVAAE